MSANVSDGHVGTENKEDSDDSKRLQQSEAQLEMSITTMLQQTAAIQDLASKGEIDEADVDAMTRLREKTCLLEHTATWLTNQLATISRQINANKAVLSPVQWLPTELLSSIFVMSTPDKWYEAPSGTIALPCAAVSRAWRSVALQTYQLWNSIVIKAVLRPRWCDKEEDCDRLSIGANPALVSVVDRYLTRSGHAPLQIVVVVSGCTSHYDTGHPSGLDKTWDALVSESARWVSAELDCPLAFFDSRKAAAFPRLQSLDIDVFGDDIEGCHPITFFQQSPIRALALRGEWTIPHGDLRWPAAWRPTRLELQYIESGSVLPILSAFAPTLERLIVHREQQYGLFAPSMTSAVSMPALRAIELISPGSDAFLIDAPKLTEIAMRGHNYFAPDDTLDALFVYDRCTQLTSLTLDDVMYDVASAVRLFETMPALSRLSLSARNTTSVDEPPSSDMVSVTLLGHLRRDEARPESLALLPALEHLELNARCDLYTIAYRLELVAPGMAMLRSRLRAGNDGVHDLRHLESFKSDMEELTLDRARAELACLDLHPGM
ncbi:hypothetical protein EV714DRAFT_274910 [Schizophyllum commune]